MIRWALFLVLAVGSAGFAHWVYTRRELVVPEARRLALLRTAALVLLLALLFDVRVPVGDAAAVAPDWVLLDASLSMDAGEGGDVTPFQEALARARALESDGYQIVRFGEDPPRTVTPEASPGELASLLAPALQRAAERGARRVVVLSDGRFDDPVAVRSATEVLPLDIRFERFGDEVPNAGVVRFEVPDFPRPDDEVTAEVEVHAVGPVDSVTVEIRAEGTLVSSTRMAAPASGLTTTGEVGVPAPTDAEGRVRYTATVLMDGDGFQDDDQAVDYATVGRREGALVVLSLRPSWEPRYLLAVLREVTGLPTVGYLRTGPDRFVRAGRAVERGGPVDAATVRGAATDAVLLVVHGAGAETEPWVQELLEGPGRRIVLPVDSVGAALAGVAAAAPQAGEWYASADFPPSPLAGAMAGAQFQGLPPLGGVMIAADPADGGAPFLVQLRGAGAPVPGLVLAEGDRSRVAVALANGFWRWSARDVGRDAYRRLWSGVAGWTLQDPGVLLAEARPTSWVVDRGAPVVWNVPPDSAVLRIVVERGDSLVVDTTVVGGGRIATGALDPAEYTYRVLAEGGDTIGSGRFDVAARVDEMLPAPLEPAAGSAPVGVDSEIEAPGRPLRTSPWPYLLLMGLLCGEWIGRRRSGLR